MVCAKEIQMHIGKVLLAIVFGISAIFFGYVALVSAELYPNQPITALLAMVSATSVAMTALLGATARKARAHA